MKLSQNFTLAEFTRSQTAIRKGIDNTPTAAHLAAMKLLCVKVLEPVRAKFGPVRLSSGYRSLALNRAIGGATSSQHSKGEAADFEVSGVSNLEVAKWMEAHLNYDQLILEYWKPSDPNAGWIHVSYREPYRNQELRFDGKNYLPGLMS